MAFAFGHVEASSIRIPAGHAWVDGDLSVPESPKGLVVFANGTGALRRNPHEQAAAAHLNEAGYASLLLDLLTPHEGSVDESTGEFSFDIPMLASRLTDVTEWLTWNRDTSILKIGYLGAGTAAAAALMAAANLAPLVEAVVARGGRPDLAGPSLAEVKAPTLLIAGGMEETVVDLNRSALEVMTCDKSMEIVHGASNAFDERGELDEVMRLAQLWFDRHLAA